MLKVLIHPCSIVQLDILSRVRRLRHATGMSILIAHPLRYLSKKFMNLTHFLDTANPQRTREMNERSERIEWALKDLNLGPTDYESAALTN